MTHSDSSFVFHSQIQNDEKTSISPLLSRTKKHRKRHDVSGPAGEWYRRIKNDISDNREQKKHSNIIQRQSYKHPSHISPTSINEDTWDHMCYDMDRIVPTFPSSKSFPSPIFYYNHVRSFIPNEYTLLYELLHHNIHSKRQIERKSCPLKVPLLIGGISNVQYYGHDTCKVDLWDESLSISKVGELRQISAWVAKTLIKKNPEWIRYGVVWYIKECGLVVFPRMESEHEDGDDEYNVGDFIFQNNAEVMIVVNEWNLQYVWTPEYNLRCNREGGWMKDNILLDLRRRRADMVTFKEEKEKLMGTATWVENDLMNFSCSSVNNQSACLNSDIIICALPNENNDKSSISQLYFHNQKKTSPSLKLIKGADVLLNKKEESLFFLQDSDNSFCVNDEVSLTSMNTLLEWNYQSLSGSLSSNNIFNYCEKMNYLTGHDKTTTDIPFILSNPSKKESTIHYDYYSDNNEHMTKYDNLLLEMNDNISDHLGFNDTRNSSFHTNYVPHKDVSSSGCMEPMRDIDNKIYSPNQELTLSVKDDFENYHVKSILSNYKEDPSERNERTFLLMSKRIDDNEESNPQDIESQYNFSNNIKTKIGDYLEDPSSMKQISKTRNSFYINIDALRGMDIDTFTEN